MTNQNKPKHFESTSPNTEDLDLWPGDTVSLHPILWLGPEWHMNSEGKLEHTRD